MILLNGNIINEDMNEHILNNGFCIYEVIRIFNGHPIFLHDNLERLSNSIQQTNFPFTLNQQTFKERLSLYLTSSFIDEGNIKYALLKTEGGQVNEYFFRIQHAYPSATQYQEGVKTVTMKAIRENPNIKYINHSLREESNQILHETGAYEAIMINAKDEVTEGSRSNIFFIKGDNLYTAPLYQVLPGTGRKRVIDICKKNNIQTIEHPIPLSEISHFDAAFITGTSPLVLPIKSINHCNFDVNNKVLRQVMRIYFEFIQHKD
ncbi:MAG: aminotransferase class IV [Marinifilaceae bacterium]